MACEEMDLFYAYLDAVEEAKRKAQPWQCEVTVFPPADDAQATSAASQSETAAAKPAAVKQARAKRAAKPAAAGFVCDPE